MVAVRGFLSSVLPPSVPVIRTVTNRVPEPRSDDWVAMTPLHRTRLATNVDTVTDVSFMGLIAGTVLNVLQMLHGTILLPSQLFGTGVVDGTIITDRNQDGTYNVSIGQFVSIATKMASGRKEMLQSTELVLQLDVHGSFSADNAQILSTVLRDDYAVQALSPSGVEPLYADDPRHLVFVNDQSQMERRWVIEAHFQVNPVVTVPMQFADELVVDLQDAALADQTFTEFLLTPDGQTVVVGGDNEPVTVQVHQGPFTFTEIP